MTLDELKTILALNGNQRIPYTEEEIFAGEELYTFYLCKLCGVANITAIHLPNCAFQYARDVIKDRWPEAEAVIATNTTVDALYYNRFLRHNGIFRLNIVSASIDITTKITVN